MKTSGTMHLTESQVSELADGTLDPREEPVVLAHIGRCDPCSREVAETRALLELSRRAKADIAAPPELWPLVASATIHAGRAGRRAARVARLLLVVAFAVLAVALAMSMRARLRDRDQDRAEAATSTTGGAPQAPSAPQPPAAPRASSPNAEPAR